MTNRPTTTTSLSANFQASNALPPLLRMQHTALRQRVHFATMRHPAEEPESSASSRSPVPFNGSDSHRTVRAVFCSPRPNQSPLLFFVIAAQQLPSAPPPPMRRRHSPTAHSAAAPPLALTTNAQQPRTTPHRRPHREAYTKRGQKMGRIWAKTLPLIRDFPQQFRASPRAWPNAPRQRPRSVRPTASLQAKTPSISRFLPSDLHLCPFLPIFAAIHVRKTSHPPSSSGLGLDSSPRPVAAIGGENLSLPRQRGAYGAHRPQRRRTRRRVSRLPARQRSSKRPRWAANGCKRLPHPGPSTSSAPPMPSAPPFAGASARRQARQLQHLPFRARPLHRSHAASILLFRFHHGNTLSFRSTLDRSHGDCSRSAARPTDRLIFSPCFFFLFSSASAHSIE